MRTGNLRRQVSSTKISFARRVPTRDSCLAHIPLYPEERACHAPTPEQILRFFYLPARTTLFDEDHETRVFDLARLPPSFRGCICIALSSMLQDGE